MMTAAIILSAGYSSRMGVFKPLLPVGGESAVHRAVGLMRGAGAKTVIVVTGYGHEKIESALGPSSARLVYNERYAEGMFTSVLKGVSSLPADTCRFFLLPVDCSAVTPEAFSKLLRAYDERSGSAVCYPEYGGVRGHPPLIPMRFTEGMQSYDGREGLRGWLKGFPSAAVPVSGPGVLMDMDTPSGYAALLAQLGLPAYPDVAAAAALLNKYGTPEDIRRHGEDVAALADRLAAFLPSGIDRALLRSAALLHDIARPAPEHARAGALTLLSEGYPAAATLVELHMELPPERAGILDEASILFLADKLSRRGTVRRPEDTLRELLARFSGDANAQRAARLRMGQASGLMDILAQYGLAFEDLIRRNG